MTGYDLWLFLDQLFYDLTHPGTADLFSVIIRLLFLCLAVWGTVIFLRVAFSVTRSLFRDLFLKPLRFVGRTVSAPVRLPAEALKKRRQEKEREKNLQEWQEREEAREEREREEREAEERRERERIAEIAKALKPD